MDVGETIPIRLFLGGFDLTPTFREVNKKYSTRYYLSLVLIDEGTVSSYTATSLSEFIAFYYSLFQAYLSYTSCFLSLVEVTIFLSLNQADTEFKQMHVAISSNQKSSSTGKHLMLQLHMLYKRNRNLSRLQVRQVEPHCGYSTVQILTCTPRYFWDRRR